MVKIPICESLTAEFKSAYNKDVIETLVAFANASGGTVFIGVGDNGRPLGLNADKNTVQSWVDEIKSETEPTIIPMVEIINGGGKEVVALSVSEYPVKAVATRGRHFKRINNLNHLLNSAEIADEHLNSVNSSWDFYIDPNHTTLDLSREKMAAFVAKIRRNKHIGLVQLSDADLLNKMEFLRYGKVSFGAYLMFAKGYCLISDVRMGCFKSDGSVLDPVLLSTDLFQEFDDIISYIKKHLAFNCPSAVIHEIVTNMIIHRDYRDSSPSVIKIFDNKIEFYNPGRLYGTTTIEELFTERYTSKSRNKLIAKAFREVAMTQHNDTGISRICRICRDNGMRPPLFRETANGFQVIVYNEKHYEPSNTISASFDTANARKTDTQTFFANTTNNAFKLSENQKAILDEIKKKPDITSENLAQIINITVRNIKVNIAKLKERGLIERIGAKKNGCWKVI